MALKPLSRIVHGFLFKWLLLPALVGLVCGSAVWIGLEARRIQKEQTYYARTVAQHVNSYLQRSHRQLKQISKFRETEASDSVAQFLSYYSPSIQAVYLLDSSGRLVKSWPQESEKLDFSKTIQSVSFQESLYLTQPYYSLAQHEVVVGMVTAASRNKLLLAELDLAVLQYSIQNLTQHMESGFAFLTDSHGNLLAHPDMSKVNQQENVGNLDIISHLQSGESKSGFYSRNKGLRLMSATSVRFSNWKVGLSQNVFSLFSHALWTIAIFLGGLLALFGVTALLFDRRLQRMIIHPLTRFTHNLDALEQGVSPVEDWEEPFSGSENCLELWSLQKNFQTMQRTVRQREASLREREEALRQSEKYYRAIFETSGSAMCILEQDTTISHVNYIFEELSGYSKQEVEGRKCWTEFVHYEDVEWMKKNLYLPESDSRSGPQNYEFRFFNRSNELRHVYLTITIIPDTTQRVVSFLDITERKRAEIALQESEEKYKRLIDTSPEAIALVDEDGKFLTVNPTMAQRFGLAQEEIEGKIYHDTMSYDLADKRIEEAKNSLNNEHIVCVEDEREGRYLQNYYVPLVTSDNQRTFQIISRDITERKQMEEKLKEMSLRDSLTGLYNRNFFDEEMDRLSDGRHDPLGIIICDLDGLKFINDTLGHQTGDQMLITIADILRGNFRASDLIARIGGDEFAVLLPQTSQKEVRQILKRLHQALQDYNNTHSELPLSLPLGSAVSEEGITGMHELFCEADNRMYREKIQREGSTRNAILQALTSSMQARDFETEGHCDRLQDLVATLAGSMDLSQNSMNDLFLLARFHDLGKVGIPDQILFKPGPLTDEEWRQMRQHCEIGHRIAFSVPELQPIADYILKHHERWDGQGYPLGVSGRNIPLACRILAIADTYDAMTSDRPYRKAMTREEAIAEFKRCAGVQFDPELVQRFIEILRDSDIG